MWVDDAIAVLVSEGFGAIEVPTPVDVDTMDAGHVYGQDPNGGDVAEPGTRVTLYVAVPLGETADTL